MITDNGWTRLAEATPKIIIMQWTILILIAILLTGCTERVPTLCNYNVHCNENSTHTCCKDVGLQPTSDKTLNLTILCQNTQATPYAQMKMIETG